MNINSLLEELQESLEKEFKDNFTGLVLFGSYARGTQKPTSDVDLLLTFKNLPKNSYDRSDLFLDILINLEYRYNIDINAIYAEERELSKSPLLVDIALYAKILKDENKRISKLFINIKKDYEKGVYKKIPRKNHYTLYMQNV